MEQAHSLIHSLAYSLINSLTPSLSLSHCIVIITYIKVTQRTTCQAPGFTHHKSVLGLTNCLEQSPSDASSSCQTTG